MTAQRRYRIDPQVFARFPGYRRGVVVALGVHNPPAPAGLVMELRAAEEALRARLSLDALLEDPSVAAWREAYRAAGMKPSEFRPSVEALARRVLRGDALPLISALVDIGTLASIHYMLPIGAHALDEVRGDLALRLARGDENFELFGSDALEHPTPGEVIFAEGSTVLTRRWTWRQAKHTLVTAETRAVEFNVDALALVTDAQVHAICEQVAAWVQAYCGGQTRWAVLSAQQPEIEI